MKVGELMLKLSRLDPELPVVIEQEDIELIGAYVEVMDARFSDDEVYFDSNGFSLDGSRPYDRPEWRYNGQHPTEPVVLLSSQVPQRPTIDGEISSTSKGLEA